MTLTGISEFVVPFDLVKKTLKPLQRAGKRGYEAFVLWGGRTQDDGRCFAFETAYVPRQTMSRTRAGLLVTVDGEALFEANRAFYDRGLTLAAQVHSHPTAAYHSDTDDAYPLMTLVGGLSGVVPNFGRGGSRGVTDWAWYRLVDVGDWAPLDETTKISFA